MKNENVVVVVAALLVVFVLATLVTLGAVGDSRRAALEVLEAQQKLKDEKVEKEREASNLKEFEELLRRQKKLLINTNSIDTRELRRTGASPWPESGTRCRVSRRCG